MEETTNFGTVIAKSGIEFINVYSDDNNIIPDGEECYFLFFNLIDFHYPLIGRGVVYQSSFTAGMSKEYYIELKEIKEEHDVVEKFMISKIFGMYDKETKMTSKRIQQVGFNFDFKNWVFKIDSFFVRDSYDKIVSLRNEYISVIKQDLTNMLNDLKDIKNGDDL